MLIPTMHNPEQLEVVLRRLLEDRDGSYSVLVIDSSKDRRTLDLCNELGVKHLEDRSPSRAYACNNGISKVTTEFTLFTDDDVIPPLAGLATDPMVRGRGSRRVGGPTRT